MLLRAQLKLWTTCLEDTCQMNLTLTLPSCLTFWHEHPKYGRLALGALHALSVPASSAPVESVFSYGGIFVRPHRAGMSETTLSALMFLKCNSCKLTLTVLSHFTYSCISELPVLRQRYHDTGLATCVVTLA